MEALASALRAHPTNAEVQRVGCCGLRFLCHASVEAHAVAGAGGAVEAVATALRMHAQSSDVLAAACFALAYLCLSFENYERALLGGASIEAVLDIMRSHPTHEDLQLSGCMALGCLYATVERAGHVPKAALQLRALAVITSALRSFSDSIAMQIGALGALGSVLAKSPAVQDGALIADTLRYVVRALRPACVQADESVQHRACEVLFRLTKDRPRSAVEAWRLGAFPLLCNILAAHKMQPAYLSDCLLAATILLVGRNEVDSNLPPLSAADAKAATCATLATMRACPAHMLVQKAACALVSELAVDSAVAAAEAGAMEAMVLVLDAFTGCVATAACKALGMLAMNAHDHRHHAYAAGAIAAVVTAMTTTPPCFPAAQEAAAFALCSLCSGTPDACLLAAQRGVVKPLFDIIGSRTATLETVEYFLHLLTTLADGDGYAAAAVVAAGPAGSGALARLLLSCTPQQVSFPVWC